MSKKRIFYSKEHHIQFFVCGETVCRTDCEICKQLQLTELKVKE